MVGIPLVFFLLLHYLQFSDIVSFFFLKRCHTSSLADCRSFYPSSSSSNLNPRPLPKTPSVHWPENMVSYRDPSPLSDSPPPPLPVKKHHRRRQVMCVCVCVIFVQKQLRLPVCMGQTHCLETRGV